LTTLATVPLRWFPFLRHLRLACSSLDWFPFLIEWLNAACPIEFFVRASPSTRLFFGFFFLCGALVTPPPKNMRSPSPRACSRTGLASPSVSNCSHHPLYRRVPEQPSCRGSLRIPTRSLRRCKFFPHPGHRIPPQVELLRVVVLRACVLPLVPPFPLRRCEFPWSIFHSVLIGFHVRHPVFLDRLPPTSTVRCQRTYRRFLLHGGRSRRSGVSSYENIVR